MYTKVHPVLRAKVGEKVTISVEVIDNLKHAVPMEGVSVEYKLGTVGSPNLLVLTHADDGIEIEGNFIYVTFLVSDVVVEGEGEEAEDTQAIGDFSDQLLVTKDGTPLYVVTGPFVIEQVIL